MQGFFLPKLIVPPTKEAQQAWAHNVLRYISFSWIVNIYDQENMRYSYAEDNIPSSKFNHVTGLYGNKRLPAFIRKVNPLPAMIEGLLGDAQTKQVTFTTELNDSDALAEKHEDFVANSKKMLTTFLRQQSGIHKQVGAPLYEGDEVPIFPEELFNLKFEEHKTDWEKIYQLLLQVFQSEPDISFNYKAFHQMYYHMVVSNKCAAERFVDGEGVNFRVWHPRKMGYSLSADSPYLDDAIMVHKTEMYTIPEIIQNYPDLDSKMIEQLNSLQMAYIGGTIIDYQQRLYPTDRKDTGFANAWSSCYAYDNKTRVLRVKVVDAYWKANNPKKVMKKDGKVDNETPILTLVDDSKNIGKESATAKIIYPEEVWRGTIFGYNLFHNCKKIDNPLTNKENPGRQKIPVTGIVINKPSFVDLGMDLVDLRLILWRKLEVLWNQPMGKKLGIDKAAGGDILKNIYNLEAFGAFEFNSMEEGANPNSPNNFKEIDMGGSQAIQSLLIALSTVDANIMMMLGTNNAASGNLKDYTANGVAQQQLAQAQLVNVSRLDNFYMVMARTLQGMCNVAPQVMRGKDILRYYFNPDHQREFMKLSMPKELEGYPNIAVNVTYSPADLAIKQAMIAAAQQIIPVSTEPKLLNAVFKMMGAPTSKAAMKIFNDAVDILDREKAEQQQIQQQQMQMQMQAQQQAKIAPAQIQAQAHVQGKQIGAQAELQKQHMKGTQEGMMQDAAKSDQIDAMMAQHELSQGQG